MPTTLPILTVTAVLASLAQMRVTAAPQPASVPAAAASSISDSKPLQEVIVLGRKLDPAKLDHVIIPRFVQSHGAANPSSRQVGRWTSPFVICPRTVGLKPTQANYVSHLILTVAATVDAPTAVYGHCKPSVEIIFTRDPQAQINYYGKTTPAILGYDAKSLQELLTVHHPIQAWYSTATHTYRGWVSDTSEGYRNYMGTGGASRLSAGIVSGFRNVLVVADLKQVSEHSLSSIANYIAMLVLTRTSVDGCSELPSIIDLLSSDCAGRPPPNFITDADVAYLKALYAADLEKNLNLEQGEMHDRMLQEVLGR